MSSETQAKKSPHSWQELLHSPITIIVGVIAIAPLFFLFEHDAFKTFSENKAAFFLAWITLVLVAFFSVGISYSCFRSAFERKKNADKMEAERRWEEALTNVERVLQKAVEHTAQATHRIEQDLKSVADQKAIFESEIARQKQNLADEKHRFEVFASGKQTHHIDETAIAEIESKTDESISVIVRNFEYELQPGYSTIIAQNLAKPGAPCYDYFVLDEGDVAGPLERVRALLETKLVELNFSKGDAKNRVHSRFKVHLIHEDRFPHCVGYGLVIYHFAPPAKNRCFLYWPQSEFGTANIDIYHPGNGEGQKIIGRIIKQLKKLPEKDKTL